MMKLPLLLLLCQFHRSVSSSELNIVSPEAIQGKYEHRYALFGHAPYGSTLEMPVYYAGSELCNPAADTAGSMPAVAEWKPPFLLMVDRGTCTFVTKARNAELYQASGILVADHRCVCDDVDLGVCQSPLCQRRSPAMADDGSGSDIRIPSLLIKKQYGDKIKDQLASGFMVEAQVTFDIPDAEDGTASNSQEQQQLPVVDYELWMNPLERGSDGHGQELANGDWKQAALQLSDRAAFTPHMLLLYGRQLVDGAGTVCELSSSPGCQFYCTNNRKYCVYDPKRILPGTTVTGAQVMYEMLRRLCIWDTYGRADGIGAAFWDYLYQFHQHCYDGSNTLGSFADEVCIKQAMETAGVNPAVIEQCIADSGGLEEDMNTILEEQLAERNDAGVYTTPYLFVNQEPVSGRKTYGTAFKAICSGFTDGTEPAICQQCSSAAEIDDCVAKAQAKAKEQESPMGSGSGAKAGVIAGSVIAAIAVLGIAIFVVVRMHKQKKNREAGSNVFEAEVSAKIEESASADGTESSIL